MMPPLWKKASTSLMHFWLSPTTRAAIIPGKDALTVLNRKLQEKYGINVTATSIIDGMKVTEVPSEMEQLIAALGTFASTNVLDN